MAGPRVSKIEFVDALSAVDPNSGEVRLRVAIEGGKESSFLAATFDRPGAWMTANRAGHWFSEPILYVARLDAANVKAAVDAMAADLGGYWLRYYRASPGAPSACGVGTGGVGQVEGGCGVAEIALKDGREFSILASTPDWWRDEMARRRATFYFGPMVLFLKKIDAAHAKKAAKEMAAVDELLFCRYDTPRKTLPEVLESFFAIPR